MAGNNALKRRASEPPPQISKERVKRNRWYEEEEQLTDDQKPEQELLDKLAVTRGSLATAMITKLPRELRDMIYGHIYEHPGPAPEAYPQLRQPNFSLQLGVRIDLKESRTQKHGELDPSRAKSSAYTPDWKLPYYLQASVTGVQFASEMGQTWYKITQLIVRPDEVPLFIEDQIGALGDFGAPDQFIPREHIRSLTVLFDPRGGYAVDHDEDPVPWEYSQRLREAAAKLKALLGPLGVTHKTDFKLSIVIVCDYELELERLLEALGPVVYACKNEGFDVHVQHMIDFEIDA